MGVTGQKPRPYGLKVIRGEADPDSRREPAPYAGRAETCGYLKDDGEACGLSPGWGTDHKGAGRCRHHGGRDDTSTAAGGVPPPPDLHPQLVAAWNDLAPRLLRNRVLTELDLGAVEQLLLARYFALDAGRKLIDEGVVKAGHRGAMRKHPAWQIYRDAQGSYRQWACEFGLTPSARTRLPHGQDDEMDELEDLLQGRS